MYYDQIKNLACDIHLAHSWNKFKTLINLLVIFSKHSSIEKQTTNLKKKIVVSSVFKSPIFTYKF